jgi:predicted metal-dependent phosphoesterase TrpH
MIKVLFHSHTTYSDDGKLSCQQLADLGKQYGFSHIFLSDHFEHIDNQSYNALIKECEELNKVNDCQLIPGYEKSWEGYHICGYNIVSWVNSQNFEQWCQMVKDQGGFVVSVHPTKYNFNIPEQLLKHCDGLEIWNSKWPYDGNVYPSPRALDIPFKGIKLCGQDVHKKSDFNDLGVVLDLEPSASAVDIVKKVLEEDYTIQGKYAVFSEKKSKNMRRLLLLYHGLRAFGYSTAYKLKKKILG